MVADMYACLAERGGKRGGTSAVPERGAHHRLLTAGYQGATQTCDLRSEGDPRRNGLQIMQHQRAVPPKKIRIRQGHRQRAVVRAVFQAGTKCSVLFVDDLRRELESVSTTERVHEAGVHIAVGRDLARDNRILFRQSYHLGANVIHAKLETVRRHGAQYHFIRHIKVFAQSLPQQQVGALEILWIELLRFRVKVLEAAGISGFPVHLLEAGNAWWIV